MHVSCQARPCATDWKPHAARVKLGFVADLSSHHTGVEMSQSGIVLIQGGVWVLGMIKGGAADRAGSRQGDEILRVNGQEIGSLSPFKVAGLLQGADSESDSDSFVDIEVTPIILLLRLHMGTSRCHISSHAEASPGCVVM
jgi:hypothetical protein